jgi:hypothetical protein
MFVDLSHLAAQSEHRRAALLADAENFRLARLARRAGRRKRRDTPGGDPPRPDRHEPDRQERTGTHRNDGAERRYAVPR